MQQQDKLPPDVLLLIAPGCPHCPAEMKNFQDVLKEGLIGKLEIVNIAIHPDVADKVGTRSVPWMRIGDIELTGSHTPQELRDWITRANQRDSAEYIAELLETNRLDIAISRVAEQPALLTQLVGQLEDSDTPFSVRIGIGALIEEYAHTDLLEETIPALISLSNSPQRQHRADAAHFMEFTKGSEMVIVRLKELSADPDAEISEIARESLDALEAA